MRRVDGIRSVELLRLAVSIEVYVLISVFGHGVHLSVRVLCPVSEWCPVYARHLPHGLAPVGKVLQLCLLEAVPA